VQKRTELSQRKRCHSWQRSDQKTEKNEPDYQGVRGARLLFATFANTTGRLAATPAMLVRSWCRVSHNKRPADDDQRDVSLAGRTLR